MLFSRKQHLLSRSLTFSDERNKLQEEAPPPPPPPPPGVVARLMGLESLRAAGKTPTDLMHPPPQHQPCADLLDDENHLSMTQSSVTEKWQQPATQWKLDLDDLEEEEHQDAPFGPSGMRTTLKGPAEAAHQAARETLSLPTDSSGSNILKERKGFFLTPESCLVDNVLHPDLDAKLRFEPTTHCLESIQGSPYSAKNQLGSNHVITSSKNLERQGSCGSDEVCSRTEEEASCKVIRRSCSCHGSTGRHCLTSNLSASEVLWGESAFSSHHHATEDDHDHGSKLLVQQGNLGIFHEHSLIAEKSQPSSPFLLSSQSHLLSSPKILGSPEASILEFKTNLGNQTNTSDSTHHHLFTKIELPSQRSHDPYEAQNSLQTTHRKKVDEKQKFSDRQQQINKVFSGVSNLQNDQSKKMTALEQLQMEQEQQKSPVKQVNTRWEEAQPQCKFESEFDGWSLRFVKDLQTPSTVVNRRPSLQPIGGPYGMIQQFKSRAMFKEENKETTGDQEKCTPTHSNTYIHLGASQSHQLPNPGNAALDGKVICGGVPNSGKLPSNKKHRIKREWSDEEGDSCLESQSLHVGRSTLWHSCRSIEAAAASAATLDKHSRFQPSGRKNQIKIRRPDGTVKMMKTTCCDLELLVPGDNIAGNLTGDDAVRESELTAASVPRETLLSNSQTHLLTNPQFNAGKKTSLFHATGRSVNELVFPELLWDETHLKRRSKEDDSMIRSENSTSTTPGMMCNDWIPKTFSEDFPVPGGSPKSSLQNLQCHNHDKKDLSSSSSSSSIQQGHSSLCQFFVSETEVTSLNQIWGSKLLSLPENDDNIVQLDFSTNSSSTTFHGCSSPDHNNNQEVRIDLLSIHVQQH
jgi:flagellar biosynthesis GTPase FlhF